MAPFRHQWKVGLITINITNEDIFGLPVQAIVNSEENNFILSYSPTSISGQIRIRYGEIVQVELDQMKGPGLMSLGTVLKTSGGKDFVSIYHAGFHHPQILLSRDQEDDQTEHIKVVRECARRVVDDFIKSDLKSVAFPLIGCGMFHLDPLIVAYEMMEQFLHFALRGDVTTSKQIWLTIRGHDTQPKVLDALVQAIIDKTFFSRNEAHHPLRLHVGYLDEFEQLIEQTSQMQWASWLLVRYVEMLTGYLFFNLSCAMLPKIQPMDIVKEGRPLTFGSVRERAILLARQTAAVPTDQWTEFISSIITRDVDGEKLLEKINTDRNSIAHGRRARSFEEIQIDLHDFIQADIWHELDGKIGLPDVTCLLPWVTKGRVLLRDIEVEKRRRF